MTETRQPHEHGVLSGRTALVVGGGSGIGRAIAEAFTAAGADVVTGDRKNAQVVIDVTDEESVRTAVAEASARLGRIDVLVNSAGILTESPLVEMDLATWSETLAVDLTGVFLCCRHVVPGMVERGFGRVINIASQLGIKGGHGLTHYSAAKAGVIGLTKSLALEVAEHGVLVNAIAPGPIETPLVEGITEEWKTAKRKELPLGRFGLPEEVAPTAVLLASDPGGNLFVGQTLGPNSGDVMP
jgi:3-oxoacyl-[acyl-carrier protein] reductase